MIKLIKNKTNKNSANAAKIISLFSKTPASTTTPSATTTVRTQDRKKHQTLMPNLEAIAPKLFLRTKTTKQTTTNNYATIDPDLK